MQFFYESHYKEFIVFAVFILFTIYFGIVYGKKIKKA